MTVLHPAWTDPAAPFAVLEGFHAVKHAVRFEAELIQVVTADEAEMLRLAAELAPDVVSVLRKLAVPLAPERVAGLAGRPVPTGVLGIARRPETGAGAALTAPGPVVFLDHPRHLGNLGAVVRVAAAAGAAGVLSDGDADPWHPTALRGSAGLHFALPVVRVDRLPDTRRPVVAVDPAGEPMTVGSLPPQPLLVFGSERRGIHPDVLRRARYRVAIPMRPGVSSLNLATAVAVTLYLGVSRD